MIGIQAGPVPTADEVKASDIFISCAQLDDQPLAQGREGWVSQFQRNLKVRMEQLSGDRVRVASLPMPPGQATVDDAYFEHLPQAKTMVSVVSPPFTKSEGCQRGVEEFWQGAERSGNFWVKSKPRLFKVVKTPVNERDLPPALDQFDIKLRDLLKALGYRNGRPIEQQAVYIAPPFDRRKERFKTLSAEVITQAGETFDPGLLTSFVSRLKQG